MNKKGVLHNCTGLTKGLCTAGAAMMTGILAAGLVTKRRRKAAPQSKARDADLSLARASLLRAVSQDLRAPLSGIMGSSLLYLQNHEALEDAEKLALVKNIHKEAGWLADMAGNLLALTHLESAGEDVSTREEMVEEVVGEALQKMEQRHPDLQVQALIPQNPIYLPMDALLIEQVILNLLENALIHSGSEKPVEVIVEDGESVTFIVRDYGHGIPKDKINNLWNDAPTPEQPFGAHGKSGVGLAICKAILSAHHGTLTGRNHGSGAEFIFTLPKRSD